MDDKLICPNQTEKEPILYKELAYETVGCFYNVYNALGPGHKELIYQKALGIEFDNKKITYCSQKKLAIEYDGKKIGTYEPDFVIDDKIIVEIKSVLIMPQVFEKQLFYYLRGSKYRLGYLINFGSDKIDIRRRIL
ncbi:MAG: GxxExxY protein [Candidatus Omnitrophica bacterium]|nr:GxxExxY protein [Candidatus Omnitrophota bacterium]